MINANNNMKHRFTVGQMIYDRVNEECYTISQLKFVNGHPCYYVAEVSYLVSDADCSEVPQPVNA